MLNAYGCPALPAVRTGSGSGFYGTQQVLPQHDLFSQGPQGRRKPESSVRLSTVTQHAIIMHHMQLQFFAGETGWSFRASLSWDLSPWLRQRWPGYQVWASQYS
jgi:hypothetical protein